MGELYECFELICPSSASYDISSVDSGETNTYNQGLLSCGFNLEGNDPPVSNFLTEAQRERQKDSLSSNLETRRSPPVHISNEETE